MEVNPYKRLLLDSNKLNQNSLTQIKTAKTCKLRKSTQQLGNFLKLKRQSREYINPEVANEYPINIVTNYHESGKGEIEESPISKVTPMKIQIKTTRAGTDGKLMSSESLSPWNEKEIFSNKKD